MTPTALGSLAFHVPGPPVAAASPAPSGDAVLVDALARVAAEDAKERDALVNEPAGGGAHVAGAAQTFGPGPASEGAHPWE